MATEHNPTMFALDQITSRRNVPWNHVDSRPIDEAHLTLILEAANQAPTHKYTEPWRFIVYTGDGRSRFAETLSTAYREAAGDKFMQKKYDKALTRPVTVPVVIAVAVAFSGKVPEFEETLAVGAAVQNLQLAAHVLDIGCSWSTPAYMEAPSMRALMGLEENMKCYGFLYLGYKKESAAGLKSIRRPIDEKVTRVDA